MATATTTISTPAAAARRTNWLTIVRELGPTFAARAAAHDANDSFVADNYTDLKKHQIFSAGVPAELGGGGASHAERLAKRPKLAIRCKLKNLLDSFVQEGARERRPR